MFTIGTSGLNVTTSVTRINGTFIEVNYTDNQAETTWIHVLIKHKTSSFTYSTDYSTNYTGNSLTLLWGNAVNETDYVIVLTAMKNGVEQTLTFTCVHTFTSGNPWDLFESFGTWPFPSQYLIGFMIVLIVFGIFSYYTYLAGTFMGLLVATMLNYINWLAIPWALVGLAWVVFMIGVARHEKKTEGSVEP
jgi:hypothetical protein